jgi:hypothetical protein
MFLLLVCGNCLSASAQGYPAKIKTITSQTADLLTFRVSVPQHKHAARENVVISYTVRNDSRRVAYLVLEPKTRLDHMDAKFHAFTVASPVKYQEEWTRYDNTFVKLRPGQSYSGKLVIDGAGIPPSGNVDWQEWEVQVKFAYVFNPAKKVSDELLQCVDTTYSFPCLGALEKAASVFTVGAFLVEVLPPAK